MGNFHAAPRVRELSAPTTHAHEARLKNVPYHDAVDAFIAAHFPAPDVHVHGAKVDDFVFSRTVGPQQQAAIVAWAELAAVAATGTPALPVAAMLRYPAAADDDQQQQAAIAVILATPPALPVMVAAMLRRPALERFLEYTDPLEKPLTNHTPNPINRELVYDNLRRLVTDGVLADALLAVPLHPWYVSEDRPANIATIRNGIVIKGNSSFEDFRNAIGMGMGQRLLHVLIERRDVAGIAVLLLTFARGGGTIPGAKELGFESAGYDAGVIADWNSILPPNVAVNHTNPKTMLAKLTQWLDHLHTDRAYPAVSQSKRHMLWVQAGGAIGKYEQLLASAQRESAEKMSAAREHAKSTELSTPKSSG